MRHMAQSRKHGAHPCSHSGSTSLILFIANASTHPFSFCSILEREACRK